MDFAYLLGQAKIESSLDPNAKASTSSAKGLYQFLDQSWLGVVSQHGPKYGLGWAAGAIGQSASGRYYVADPNLRQQILDLRSHPETASVMAAEHAADNKDYLESRLGAAKLLAAHDQSPGASAASLFPAAARANRGVFYDRAGNPRSFGEIRNNFAAKLEKGVAGALAAPAGWAGRADDDDFSDTVPGGQTVQPADYVRIETQRLQQTIPAEDMVRPQPQTARLAYLMLATLGR